MSPSICILSVLVVRVSNKTISVPISLRELQKDNKTVDLEALLQSRTGKARLFSNMRKITFHANLIADSNSQTSKE